MKKYNSGLSIWNVISIIAFLILIFILALPRYFNLDKKKHTEQCIKNMKLLHKAVTAFMNERDEEFSGDAVDLVRMGYLKKPMECPENGVGDKYLIKGVWQVNEDGTKTPKVNIECPNHEKHPDHVLPVRFQ